MSLVNDMLNDLQTRRADQQAPELELSWLTASNEPVDDQSTASPYERGLRWAVMIALVAVIATVAYQYLPPSTGVASTSTQASTQTSTQTSTHTSKIETATPVITEPARVSAVEPITAAAKPPTQEAPSQTAEVLQEQPAAKQNMQENVAASADSVGPATSEAQAMPAIKQTVKKVVPKTLAEIDKQMLSQAKQLITKGRVSQAEVDLKQFLAIRAAPLSGEFLASIYMQQNRLPEAQQVLSQVRLAFPDDIGLITTQARWHIAQNQFAEAVTLLRQQQPLLVNHVDYYELLGASAQRSGDYQLSDQTYRTLLAFDASKSEWWVGLAIAKDLQGEQQAAINAYQRALSLTIRNSSLQDYAQQRLAALSAY